MKKKPFEWRNRIVGYGNEVADQLMAHPNNWRIHPKAQQDALSGVLREVGLVQNIIVNKRTGTVVDGHLRVALALREGQPTLPVTYVDLDEHEEALILATLDPISAMAAADKEKLDALLREVQTGDAAVQQTIADLAKDLIPLSDWTDVKRDETLVDQFEHFKGDSKGDENWFYVTFYGKGEEFQELSALIGDHLKGAHELEPGWFTSLIRGATDAQA